MTTDSLVAHAKRRLDATRAAIAAAEEADRQTIRDLAAENIALTDIAAALGIFSRKGIYAAINAEPAPPPTQPLRPAIFLRGAGAPQESWDAIATAMHTRGWATVLNRTHAWHLARGGTPVVLVDFSANRAEAMVGRVQAKYSTITKTGPVSSRLSKAARADLQAAAANWLETPTQWEEREMVLPLAGLEQLVPHGNPGRIARAVAHQLID